jgi:pilus assembly protein CpaC
MSRKTNLLYRTVAATIGLALIAGTPTASIAAPAKVKKTVLAKRAPGRPVVSFKSMQGIPARVAPLPPGAQRPTTEVLLSVGQGELINLPENVADVWTSNATVADVYVSNPRQIHLFGKEFGEATIFATTAGGQVVYASNIRVSQNITSVDRMLALAMPDAKITVTTVGQLAVLTGTVATPDDATQAAQLVTALLNPGVDVTKPDAQLKIGVVSRLRTATPLQVNLQVRIAEVSRSLSKQIGANLLTRDTTGGFQFNVAQGRNFTNITNYDTSSFIKLDASSQLGLPAGSIQLPWSPSTGFVFPGGTSADFKNLALGAGKTSLGFLGKLFGVDVASAIDLAETNGLVTLLAEPNLTAVSGETASFLAGGEFPIPISQTLGQISIEYKQYGVSLAFTPTVLADGRISVRVRPEVSQLSTDGAVTLNGFTVPSLTTRRTETTVELGSGQSFMIGGLLQNNNANSVDKAPGLGDVPVLGSLFRSTGYRRNQTELMIIVTPYLVKPVDANSIALPTDGFKTPTDLQNFLLGQDFGGKSGGQRPKPSMAPPVTVPAPGMTAPSGPTPSRRAPSGAAPAPGFSGN